jgi:PAS domain S-box-containing protein
MHKNGHYVDVSFNGNVIHRQDGSFKQMYGILQDITPYTRQEKESTQLIDGMNETVWLIDFNGDLLDVNKSAINVLGYSKEELFSIGLYGIDSSLKKEDIQELVKAMPSDKIQKFETSHTTKYGRTFPVEISSSLISYKNKNAILSIARDITERKQAEKTMKESKELLDLAMSVTNDGIWDWNLSTNEVYFDPRYYIMAGYEPDEFPHKFEEFQKRVHPEDIDRVMNQAKKLIEGEINRFQVEFRFKRINEEWMWIQGVGKIVKRDEQGRPIRFVGTHSDISDRKKVEEELKSLNERLEQKVEERTNEIQHLLQQKDEFINQLGHDLKNPLGPFMQLLPILKNHVTDEKDKQMIDVLDRNARYMRNLVKKTIELAKLNSDKTKFTFSTVSLHDLVEDVLSANAPYFSECNLEVYNKVLETLFVFIDQIHIHELLTNLLNNAVKYSNRQGIIEINAQQKEDTILVSVSDTGIGVSEEQIQFLFDEYYKADSSRHDFDSSGLGLPICKRIIERHGGRIWVESKGLGKGSTVYFTLPIQQKKSNI